MQSRLIAFALLLIWGVHLTGAASVWAAEPQKLSLAQLTEYALKNNGELKALQDEKGIKEANRNRAGLLPNPTLEFEASTGAVSGSDDSTLSLGVSQEFLLGGKRSKRVAVADLEMEAYRWQLAERQRTLLDEVKTAFYSALLAEMRLSLADQAILLNQQLNDVAKERLAAGDIPELEANLVKVELARSEGTRITALREVQQTRSKLRALLGIPASELPMVSGNLATSAEMTKTLEELKRLARSNRPDIKVMEAERARGNADITLAQAESIPNLTAGLSVGRETSSMEIGGLEGKDTAYLVGLKLSIPLPLFNKNQAGIQEARAKRNSTESRLFWSQMNLDQEVETAYAGHQNAENVVSLYRNSILGQLEENLKLTQEAYRLGEVGVLDVIQEQKKFIDINESYLAAQFERQLALVKLETAVGVDLFGGAQ